MNDLPDPQERAVSPVASPWRLLRTERSRQLAMGAVGLGAVAFMALGIHAVMTDKGIETKPADLGVSTIAQTVANPPETVAAPPKVEKHEEPPPNTVKDDKPPPAVAQAPYVMFPASSGEVSFEVPTPPARDEKAAGGGPSNAAAGPDVGKTQVAFKPATMVGGRAGPAMHMTYVMRPQPILCRLDQALESTLAGVIFCSLTQDVLSDDHVVLMRQGDHVTGTYKNEIAEGQHRMFAISATAITQEGIPVPLEGQMADALGRTGIVGDYDAHILERFGAAGALTAFQSGMNLAQAMFSKGGNTYLNLNSGGGTEELASEILRSQIGIKPTISVPPGTVVSIMLDKPISFEDALHVETRR